MGSPLIRFTIALIGVGMVLLAIGVALRGRSILIVSMALTALAIAPLVLFRVGSRRVPGSQVDPDLESVPAAEGSGPTYDDLDVTVILTILPQLERGELDVLREHEIRHRARPGVLTGIDQLLAGGGNPPTTPVAEPTYDDLDVESILPVLPQLDREELVVLRHHEASHGARPVILSRIDDLLT
jgi:hypothetical protein